MKKLGLLAAVVAASTTLAFAPAATAGPCDSDGQIALGQIAIGDGNFGTIYIDDRNFALGNGTWIYAETNGIQHLQRGGESALGADLGGRDSCVEGDGPYDTIIF